MEDSYFLTYPTFSTGYDGYYGVHGWVGECESLTQGRLTFAHHYEYFAPYEYLGGWSWFYDATEAFIGVAYWSPATVDGGVPCRVAYGFEPDCTNLCEVVDYGRFSTLTGLPPCWAE